MSTDNFTSIKASFFKRVMESEPQEATALGLDGYADKLPNLSESYLDSRVGAEESMLAQLPTLNRDELCDGELFDFHSMWSLAQFRVHSFRKAKLHLDDIEASVLPHSLLQFQIAHSQEPEDWEAIAGRIEAIPTYLEQAADNLAKGKEQERLRLRSVKEYVYENEIPAIISFFESGFEEMVKSRGIELSPQVADSLTTATKLAAAAYRQHLEFLVSEILPNSTDDFALGEEEVQWRLLTMYGVKESPQVLIRSMREQLKGIGTKIIQMAHRLAPGKNISSLERARELVWEIQSESFQNQEELIPHYRYLTERATNFIRERQLFRLPEGFELALMHTPEGLEHAVNWPGPLMNSQKEGCFLVNPDPSTHSKAWSADVAVHEGVPGHYLQSLLWQRAFGVDPYPVRFLGNVDFCAMASQFWGPMLNIEGFAVYTEELMRKEGFFTDQEEICVLISHAVRAARVVADLGMHTKVMTDDDAFTLLTEQACLQPKHARFEVERYKRIPLQAASYALGQQQIESFKDDYKAQKGNQFIEMDFHEAFLEHGPVAPTRIHRSMMS